MKNRKVLVTGGAGFIGSHLVDALIKKGDRVVAIDNLYLGRKENINPKAKFYKIDIQDPEIENIFIKEKFDFVYHEAGQVNLRLSLRNPIFDAQNNILGSLNLLENSLKYKIKKFIFASTGGAFYGDAKVIPTPENYLSKPISPYAVAKLTVENYLNYYHKVFGLSYVVLRYANVYGPRQNPMGEAGVIAIFIDRLLKNKLPLINGTGRQTRDYVYIDDVVKANLLALENEKTDTFNVSTAKETNVLEILNKLIKLSGKKIKAGHCPAIPGEQKRSCLSYAKIKKNLKWNPEIGLEEGLKRTMNWFKKK